MKQLFIIIITLLWTSSAIGQDRIFAYTYQSNVLNKGDFDIEYHTTFKTGKQGAYSPYMFGQSIKQRLEFEIGLGKKVQTAFYFNTELFQYADTSSTEMNQELTVNFSNEWKWKLSDPVANSIGSALYAELEFGGSNVELEGKLILDKRLPKDLFAVNIIGTYEIEKEITRTDNVTTAEWENSSAVDFELGYIHFIKPSFGIGIEAKNNNDISGDDGWINSVLFAGVALHSSIDKFFINLTAMPQLANLYKTDEAPGNFDYNNYEKLEVRLLIGYSF